MHSCLISLNHDAFVSDGIFVCDSQLLLRGLGRPPRLHSGYLVVCANPAIWKSVSYPHISSRVEPSVLWVSPARFSWTHVAPWPLCTASWCCSRANMIGSASSAVPAASTFAARSSTLFLLPPRSPRVDLAGAAISGGALGGGAVFAGIPCRLLRGGPPLTGVSRLT